VCECEWWNSVCYRRDFKTETKSKHKSVADLDVKESKEKSCQ